MHSFYLLRLNREMLTILLRQGNAGGYPPDEAVQQCDECAKARHLSNQHIVESAYECPRGFFVVLIAVLKGSLEYLREVLEF